METIKLNHPLISHKLTILRDKKTEHGYIVPGLGDAGDRIFGTK